MTHCKEEGPRPQAFLAGETSVVIRTLIGFRQRWGQVPYCSGTLSHFIPGTKLRLHAVLEL